MHKTTAAFWAAYEKLPQPVQLLADKNFELLKQNPQHPSLRFKKLGKFWSVRIGINYRALAVYHNNTYYWHWVGSHAEYDLLIS